MFDIELITNWRLARWVWQHLRLAVLQLDGPMLLAPLLTFGFLPLGLPSPTAIVLFQQASTEAPFRTQRAILTIRPSCLYAKDVGKPTPSLSLRFPRAHRWLD